MSYRLQSQTTLAEDIRRIAYEQMDKALVWLNRPRLSPDKAIHEARKNCKKLRALLRLVRDELGEAVYKRENICLRDAGRLLSAARDSVVDIQTLSKLEEKHSDSVSTPAFDPLYEALIETHENALARAFGPDQAVDQAIVKVQTARKRIATWPLANGDFASLAPSIQRVYTRGYQRFRDARAAPTPAVLHDWRKRVKYLWYHLRLLRPIWPALLATLADELHDLANKLGAHHDLVVLQAHVTEQPIHSQAAPQLLFGLISEESQALEAQALTAGRRLYVEKPERYVARLGAYWDSWQAAGKDHDG